jgi:zinc protease
VKKYHLVRNCYLILGLVAVFIASTAGAQDMPKLRVEKYTLPNGLEVLLHEDHSTPVVSVNTWYKVGSGDEKRGRTGFAHLFEHIMFMGSEHVPNGEFDQLLEAAGASNNGSTTEDRTNYYENLPSNALPLALWLDADRMGYLLPTMDLAKVNVQRDVVKNERRQSVDNVPYGRADEVILAAVYPSNHPYSWSVIGSMADLSAASLEDVQNFFRTYYAPNNATLSIAGDFDSAEAKRLVSLYFGGIPRGPALPPRPVVPNVVIAKDTFLVMEDQVQLPRVFYTWHTVKAFDADEAALDVLASVLTSGKNSRLYKKLVYDMQTAQSVNASQNSGKLDGLFQIDLLPKPGVNPATLDKVINEEVQRVMNEGITQRELERVKNSIRSLFLNRLASVGGFGGKADMFNEYNYMAGTPDYIQQDAARYQAVTPGDVQRVARKYLSQHKVVLTVVPPGKKDLMVTANGGDR